MSRTKLLLALCLLAAHAWSQSTRGTILGNVTDASGAAVPSAEVVIINQGTNVSVTTRTGNEGEYTVTNLDPGTYRVNVGAQGFRSSTVQDVILQVSQTVRQNVQVTVGDVASSVSVEATAPVVQSDTSAIGSVVDQRQIETIPLNGRGNINSLLAIAPGVMKTGQNPIISGGVWFGSTNMTVDGVSNIDTGNERLSPLTPSLEAIGEFRVISNGASAEYGRGGAQVIVATREGTNALHGSLFAFNRNAALSAKNFFATSLPKPPFNRNEFGGSIGGRIIKDKLFYFGSFEGLRLHQSITNLLAVPTAALKSGNFAGLAAIRDPTTNALFQNNVIPTNRINSVAAQLLKYSPDSNQAGTGAGGLGNNYLFNSPTRESNDRYSTRADYNLTSKDRLTGRWFQAKDGPFLSSVSNGTALYGNWNGFGTTSWNVLGSYTRLVSSRMVNEVRVGLLDLHYFRTPQNNDLDPSSFIPGLISPVSGLGGLPTVNITGFRGFSDQPGSGDRQRSYEVADTFSWTLGHHNLKAGAEYQRVSAFNFQNPAPARGQFSFDGRYTGNAFADFLLGYPFQTQRVTKNLEVEPVNSRYAWFVQDDFNVNSRLTLNLGVRYEYAAPFENSHGDLANFYPNLNKVVLIEGAADPHFATLPIVNGKDVGITPDNYIHKDKNNFAPRIGFAYRPLGRPTFVVRSSYGIFYNVIGGYIGSTGLANNPPFRAVETFDALPGNTPSLNFSNPFPGTGTIPAVVNLNAVSANRVNGYMQQWNLTLEAEVLPNTAVRASYVGNKGTHLDRQLNLNDVVPAPGVVQVRRPFQPYGIINYYDSERNSILNQLQLGILRRLSKGLSFQVEYQLSKGLSEQPFGISAPTDFRNFKYDRGDMDSIRRHLVTANYTYDLPFGKGRTFQLSGLTNALLGGWQLAGILGIGTGEPYSVTFNSTVTGWPSSRADIIGDPTPSNRSINQWFNPAAYGVPAQFTFGNSARNSLFGPNLFRWDNGFIKNTKITERLNLEFRAEFFNVLNHASFDVPAANISVPSQVGRVTSTVLPARDVQFGMRLSF
jgi:Carboxypeptidase regulatory-like domain